MFTLIASAVDQHILETDLKNVMQYHSLSYTETVELTNDILSAPSEGNAVILLMLDPSAAFDIVDYQILLSHTVYGIRGDV